MGLLDSIIFGVALGVSGAFDKDKKQIKQLLMVQHWEQAVILWGVFSAITAAVVEKIGL